jgi:type II secretory pathway pseudopilin PulG
MRMKYLRKLNQSGDTIVEVLIAIAVLTSVLGAAYSIMSLNMAKLRDNQERTEASKIAQSQIEALIGISKTDLSILPSGTSPFCIEYSVPLSINSVSAGSPAADLNADDLDTHYADCTDSTGIYKYAVQRLVSPTDSYRVYVRWDSLGGGRSEVVFTHKLGVTP